MALLHIGVVVGGGGAITGGAHWTLLPKVPNIDHKKWHFYTLQFALWGVVGGGGAITGGGYPEK